MVVPLERLRTSSSSHQEPLTCSLSFPKAAQLREVVIKGVYLREPMKDREAYDGQLILQLLRAQDGSTRAKLQQVHRITLWVSQSRCQTAA